MPFPNHRIGFAFARSEHIRRVKRGAGFAVYEWSKAERTTLIYFTPQNRGID
jgi:hypothetical protein